MSPSDTNKPPTNSKTTEGKTQECSKLYLMDSQLESVSSIKSDVTKPGHGTITNIPLITASQPTLKCSINDQKKTFDPGENGGNERLTSNHCGNSAFPTRNSSLLKNNNKNYKAGSKINKLADMLAKRSQNVVEVTQNNTSDIISGITYGPKEENTVNLNNVSNIKNIESNLNSPISLKKTAVSRESDSLKKNRRKSVPNERCNIHQLKIESNSKSCLDLTKLLSMEESNKHELNALGGSLKKLQTDESTKKKAVRKNLKNVELSLILPEKKRRSSLRTENLVYNKVTEKTVNNSLALVELQGKNKTLECSKEIVPISVPTPLHSVNNKKVRKKCTVKQRKSKRLVETSTQTADIEFISVLKSKPEIADEKLVTEEFAKPTVTYECLYCTQTFTLGSQCKAHEKTHLQKNTKLLIKCQYCSKKFPTLVEIKSHCIKKHPNKCSVCLKCNEKFISKEELNVHFRELHVYKNETNNIFVQDHSDEARSRILQEKKKEGSEEKQSDKKASKQSGVKTDLKIDVSYDSVKKSSISPRNIQKSSPKETKTEEQLLEMEMLFYSHLSGNIQENLTNHLDGKLDKSGNPVRTDQIKDSNDYILYKSKSNNLLSVVTPSSSTPDVQTSRAPSPYQTRSKTPNPLPPTAKKFKKLPNWQQKFWEKYNFPTNYRYEHKFWDKNYLNTDKSAFYLKDLSCLDIKTQLTMRENIKKLDNIKVLEENSKAVDNLKFPQYLSLIPRVNSDFNQETSTDLHQINISEVSKSKTQIKKEKDVKKPFKSPMSELPVTKTRRKLSLDNSSPSKKQSEKLNLEGMKMITRRQSSIDLNSDKEDTTRKRKGSLDISGGQRMTLRRQTSLDTIQGSNKSKVEKSNKILELNLNNLEAENTPLSSTGSTEISGEWVRPRSYLCGTCCAKFTNLWELEDHKWVTHPNVWCTHYEFEDEKIDKIFQKSENDSKEINSENSVLQPNLKLTDLYKRYLLPNGSLKTAKLVPNITFPEQCTKCKKHCMNSSEMHKHMLDCGGDTTWFLTMYSSPMTIKRKWRPFGSRRRKQIGRRDIKRNIPSTPTLRSYHYQHRIRTKPGDVETIQKMLANLPEKRARRAINFDDIKTRSQATIHSNRLLRKRFKTSFTTNFLNLKNKRNHQINKGKKESSSKSATDASSESTPAGSPKRRNKLKENVLIKEENTNKNLIESLADKKKVNNKNNETVLASTLQNTSTIKSNKRKAKTTDRQVKSKPITRSNTLIPESTLHISNSTRHTPIVKEDNIKSTSLEFLENISGVITDSKKLKENLKSGKKAKNGNNKTNQRKEESEVPNLQVYKSDLEIIDKNVDKIPKKLGRKKLNLKINVSRPDMNSDISKKTKTGACITRSDRLLRIKQTRKEKTELIKRIKKKFKNSKKVLDLKGVKKAGSASRRSQRIRSLQMPEENSGISETKEFAIKTEDNESFQRDTKLKNIIISLPNAGATNSVKFVDEKEAKRNLNEDLKESVNIVENIRPDRKCTQTLRNSVSLEEKEEESDNLVAEKIFGNMKKLPFPRRISKTVSKNEPITPNFVETVQKHKKAYRIQNVRILRRENPCNLIAGRQISLLKKNRIQSTSLVRLGDSSETKNIKDIPKSNDLAEMPVLAKVEPIRGKTYVKNETKIPVLMPIEKEINKDIQLNERKQTPEKEIVSFQVIKNKRKTSKQITPLKIVKKIENVPAGNSTGFANPFSQIEKDNTSSAHLSPSRKNRKRKNPIVCLEKRMNLDEKRNKKLESKKYFLGVCPNEIDKGRINVPDDSGSDSEPLISLITNQKEFSTMSIFKDTPSELNVKQDFKVEIADSQNTLSSNMKQVSDGKNKVKVDEIAEITPNSFDTDVPGKDDEKNENATDSFGKIHAEQSEVKKGQNTENEKISKCCKIKNTKKLRKKLRMTVTLKEPTLKILDVSPSVSSENKWTVKVPEEKTETDTTDKSLQSVLTQEEGASDISKENVLPERRSRRISKEIKTSNEFIIDDPLILVDELWSDLDSDSDCSKKKSKKGKKKTFRKKSSDEKRVSDVKLEELLRNFGENKDIGNSKKSQEPLNLSTIKVVSKKNAKTCRKISDIRKSLESHQKQESNNRLSLKLFRFRKSARNFGNRGEKLSDVKKALRERQDEMKAKSGVLPDLPFLAAEIKENPLQVIQCGAQKTKSSKKIFKKFESKSQNSKINFKISLPLESINNMAIFNNNHLTELIIEETPTEVKVVEKSSQNNFENECFDNSAILFQKEKENQISQEMIEPTGSCELKIKPKRSEVIDKIFYCEICKTYYYSSSQLKIHKLSNRHKLKESELAKEKCVYVEQVNNIEEITNVEKPEKEPFDAPLPIVENITPESSKVEEVEAEKQNDDTLEMPTLEGPFIENPLTRVEVIDPVPSMPPINNFGFTQESLKDIQRAIGCTDEEMLILTLLGENTVEIENDILDLDSYKLDQQKMSSNKIEKAADTPMDDKANGSFKVDLKQRMTSALACLVNKAVFNLLQKYDSTTKTVVNPEALSFLGKMSNLSRRKNILELNDLLKKQNDGESSITILPKDLEKKEPIIPYKYQCTICGSRFEKASTRECHISRSHRGKAKKTMDEVQASEITEEVDWNDPWDYENNEDHLVNTNSSQFWCSDCGINFLSPQEVLEHQKLEHQAAVKEIERSADAGPLQSSTIGSSDEIVEGKKTKPRPKFFSSEELDQQRIIANNELRKLDRKFASKNKISKNKWGMDALKFTLEKENKMIVMENEKTTTVPEDISKAQGDAKNFDLIPKLNLSRTGNIPEFKVIQKSSFKNRFQKIIDNKLKRRITRHSQQDPETDDAETEVMLLPVVVKKKNKKQKSVKYVSQKHENEKVIDVYDFNESESEIEPMVFSHIKKTMQPAPKLKLVKLKEEPSKNKADSTTKGLLYPDDYDSEDSLPLSIVKKSKTEEEEDKEEKTSEEGVEKSEGILEQVEYLIGQLENETVPAKKKKENEENVKKGDDISLIKNKDILFTKDSIEIDSIDSAQETFRASLTNTLLQLENTSSNHQLNLKSKNEQSDVQAENKRIEAIIDRDENILADPESSQCIFDDEDSMPLVLMSKKAEILKSNQEDKKYDENSTDFCTTPSENIRIFGADENKSNDVSSSPSNSQPLSTESSLPLFSFRENENIEKPFKSLNENIYGQNDSLSEFGSDSSNDGLIHSNFENSNLGENNQNLIKEITEKEDVVIICSRRAEEESNESKESQERSVERKKKKRFPLLTATIEENNFRKSESPKLNKEVIVRKIWNRRKVPEGSTDNEENSFSSTENDNLMENVQNDESQTEIEKEIIVKKIWSRKKLDHDGELNEKPEEKFQDLKINQTEVSDEVIIKCGPKTKQNPKRRKSKSSTNESSKETIMRKIWSGKCFQTKAALKTYDSEMLSNSKEDNVSEEQTRPKKRGRPAGLSSAKRSKVEVDNDDDLDSLLEEIEREQLEKAIRLEFLHMRRSEKNNGETMKDGPTPTVGLFTETNVKSIKKVSDRKRKKVRKKINHPRQSVLKRRKFMKKPIRKILQTDDRPFNECNNRTNYEPVTEQSENPLGKKCESFDVETKIKNRKHKKHRHKHHHHKHKHKKSKHHKNILNKHKSKHKFEGGENTLENAESFSILEKICQNIPNQIENEWQFNSSKKISNSNLNDLDSNVTNGINSPFSFENKTKDCDDIGLNLSGKDRFESENRNIYDFAEDIPDLPLKDN